MGIYMIHVHLLEYIMLGVRVCIYMIHVHLLEYIMLGVRVWYGFAQCLSTASGNHGL